MYNLVKVHVFVHVAKKYYESIMPELELTL